LLTSSVKTSLADITSGNRWLKNLQRGAS